MLLRLEEIARSVGARTLFRGVGLSIGPGDRIGLVGPNGAGKTTLLRIAAGLDPPDAGRVVKPRGVRVGLLRQEVDPGSEVPVRDEAASVLAHLDALEDELRQLETGMARLGREGADVPSDMAERYDRARSAFEFAGGFARESRVERVLAGLGFSAAAMDRPLRAFSGGWLMRVELAKLLLAAPDVLLLDEPTNHLDLPSIEWFEETLSGFRGAVVAISHDRSFLRRQAGRIAELDAGRFTLYEGGYDRYLEQRADRREQQEARARNQARRIAEQERFIERFRYKASKARQVQGRIRALDKLERIEAPSDATPRLRLRLPEPPRSGESVLRLEGIHKSYGETRVYEGIDFSLRRGERVALVGPNGAGKSTLLRIAAGVLEPDAGTRQLGHNVQVAFYAQHQLEVLDPARTVLAELERVARTEDVPRLRGHLGAFLFSGDDVDKKVAVLSGGEKARLALARLLLRPVNFLVLDEPTNHLDLAACEVLEEALDGYAGTLLFISHDRTFLDGLATKLVEVRDGGLCEHLGGYAEYRRHALAAAGAAASAPQPAPSQPPASKSERMEARQQARARARRVTRARREVERLETQIAQREERLEALGWRLGDPEVYRDGEAVRGLEAERGELRRELDERYAQWERAAAELEEAEGEEAEPRGRVSSPRRSRR
jgi:ATP-binding cassette subfamily F protein 3